MNTETQMTLELHYGDEDAKLSREEFRHKFKRKMGHRLMGLQQDWAGQLANVFGEIVKNFYDHANRRGHIEVLVSERRVEWKAYDDGPGDTLARTVDEIISQTLRNREKYRDDSRNENCGLGLALIHGALNGLRTCRGVERSVWELYTRKHYAYKGVIDLH